MDLYSKWLLSIISGVVLIIGIYLLNSHSNPSLKVMVPLCILILGLSICSVISFNSKSTTEQSYTITNLIIHEKPADGSTSKNIPVNSVELTLQLKGE